VTLGAIPFAPYARTVFGVPGRVFDSSIGALSEMSFSRAAFSDILNRPLQIPFTLRTADVLYSDPFGYGIMANTSVHFRSPFSPNDVALRRAYLNEKFGRTGDLHVDINNKVDIGNANFAQRDFRSDFSKRGSRELSKLTGMNIRTTNDLVSGIQSGVIDPSIIPVNVIVRDGQTLILNTRTTNALQQAGVPRSSFNVINQTNNMTPVSGGKTFNDLLTEQLLRNNLSNRGIRTTTQQ
jgi:hypothetical protein